MTDKVLSAEELKKVKDSFDFADADSNGAIEFKEFAELLRVLSPDTDVEQAATGFSMVDTDSDGQISYDEFVTWWQQVWWEF